MAVKVTLKTGTAYWTDLTIAEAVAAVRDGESFDVWWYAPWGQRFRETLWVAADELAAVMTESDDG
jgi:hypothetical protein